MSSNSLNQDHYYFVDYLRALSCFLVIWHHTLGYLNKADISIFYLEYLKKYTASVPVFIVISAFVYARYLETREVSYKKYITGRINRILVPYFTISIITLSFKLFTEYTNYIPVSKYEYVPFSAMNALINIFFAGVADHYYFLEIIFIYLALYPVVVNCFCTKWQALTLLFAYLALYEIISPAYETYVNASGGAVSELISEALWGGRYFLLGFVLYKFKSFYWEKAHSNGLAYGVALFFMYAILLKLFPNYYNYLTFILISSYIMISIQFAKKIYKPVKTVSNLSYGIFIFHQPYFIKASLLISGMFFPSVKSDIRVVMVWALSCATVTIFIYYMQRVALFNRLLLGTNR